MGELYLFYVSKINIIHSVFRQGERSWPSG